MNFCRAPGADAHMFTGHSIETLWIVMDEALRQRDRALFDRAAPRIRRLLEMSWDHVFTGLGDGNYRVFGDAKHPQGPDYSVKTMWAHCEAMIACMMILERAAQPWAGEWYERLRAFTLRTMPRPEHGVWRQAVDRLGKDVKRAGVSTKRKDNLHQARYLMLNLLSLERMIANAG
jgi:N-acylglucosamine 2-epimerase